jgi:HD superfamily phosphohydrolase
MMLILEEIIYGTWEMDGVLKELVLSAPIQHLKAVHPCGANFLVDPSQQHTRYEHSLGVCWMLRHFGGSLKEQISALLHDVSTTAFFHVGVRVFGHPGEDYHEQIFAEVIARSDVRLRPGTETFRPVYLLEQPLPRPLIAILPW